MFRTRHALAPPLPSYSIFLSSSLFPSPHLSSLLILPSPLYTPLSPPFCSLFSFRYLPVILFCSFATIFPVLASVIMICRLQWGNDISGHAWRRGRGRVFFQEWHQQEKSFLSLSICLFSLFHRFHSLFFSFHESVLAEINIYIYMNLSRSR